MATRKTTLALLLALAACSKGGGTRDGGGTPVARIDRADDPIPYQYLVVLQPGQEPVAEVAAALLSGTDAWTLRTYERAVRGFAVHASPEMAAALSRDARVARVAEDGWARAQALTTQDPAPAALDRIDQRSGTDGTYAYPELAGDRVHAYVLDTGVLASHTEFLGRPPDQLDFVRDGETGDCNGHGTHVAALLGGATFGVAKKVTLHSLRVLGCNGAGSTSDIVAALDWLAANAQTPAVVNLSLGRGADATLDAAVEAVVAAGIPVVVAAGDARRDACTTSPARTPGALAVGATDPSGTAAASFSNHGPCIDLFAPGVDVRSAAISRPVGDLETLGWSESVLQSGTSASAPLVAGAVALYLGRFTGATPEAVATALVANSTRAPGTLPRYTPDRFLFTPFVEDDNSADGAVPSAAIDSPATGATVSGEAVAVTGTADDDVGVTRVELFANGRFIGSSEAPPFSFTWDSRREPNGPATLVLRAYDRAGHLTASAPVTVDVSNVGVAHPDPALGVPRCDTKAPVCDSLELLAGRADLGPEENAPNTLAEACPTGTDPDAVCICADGSFGLYELDESIEAIVVKTRAGGNLAVGADVDVAVTVFIGSTANDAVDLYSSPTVAPPAWRFLGSLKANASGSQVLTGSFTLPAGEVQAVRAAMRYGGGSSTCTDGGFDERDDLAFVVDGGTPDTTPPDGVAITAPKPLDKVEGTIQVTATANDTHLVSRVEFTVGPNLIGTDFDAPFGVAWNSGLLPDGMYDFKATAYDGAGNVTESAPVRVQIKDETPPSVAFVSPKEDLQVATTPITVKVAAADNGVVRKVELEVDGTTWAISTTPAADGTWEFTWGDVPRPAAYQLVAIAEDGATPPHTTRSAVLQVLVGDTVHPTCRIKSPDPMAEVVGNVFLEAEALDDTEVAQVRFFQVDAAGDIDLGTANSLPFAVYWESGVLTNGDYSFYCLATDTTGNETEDHRTITLKAADTKAPSVEILSPAVTREPPDTGAVVPTHVIGMVAVRAGAADDGAVQKVEFYLDDATAPFAFDETEPYEAVWDSTTVTRAVHTLTAKAYDYNGHSTLSAPLQVDTGDSTPPTVAILFPLANAVVDGLVPVKAQVTDPEGAITKVQLLEGGVVLQELTAAPWEFTWDTTGLTAGAHALEVRATDVGDGVGTASVALSVEPTGAVYDPALGAPACAAEGARCHSSALLDGRGPLGPEPQEPNTLGGGCPDGGLGTYHVDESIDFISVKRVGDGGLASGAQATLTVKAWIFSPLEDRIELFYAADATNPQWVGLPAPVIEGSGAQTVTATYTLPDGPFQAVRASVRYAPAETGACVLGDFNDTDDLAFGVDSAADTTPPTVAITSPANASNVAGLVAIAADATDERGVASVEFLVDGVLKGTSYAAPYTWTWDTAGQEGGDFTLTARAYDTAGNAQLSAPVTVHVPARVALTAPLASETVQGTVPLAAESFDFDGVARVEFRVGGATVASASAAPYAVSWNSASVSDGIVTVVARAFDPGGSFTDSAPVSILVSNLGNASWNNGYKAPACANAATKCFTGTLVDGRGPLGPEANAPNTLGAACADGTQGSYHVDESIDAVTVRGSKTFATGDTVTVEVKVWATQAYEMDSLDLYSTADATAATASWVPIATLKPTRPGAQVLTASYTLPAGATQAVRAQLRYGGDATFVCGAGTFDDRDDVVFVVGP